MITAKLNNEMVDVLHIIPASIYMSELWYAVKKNKFVIPISHSSLVFEKEENIPFPIPTPELMESKKRLNDWWEEHTNKKDFIKKLI